MAAQWLLLTLSEGFFAVNTENRVGKEPEIADTPFPEKKSRHQPASNPAGSLEQADPEQAESIRVEGNQGALKSPKNLPCCHDTSPHRVSALGDKSLRRRGHGQAETPGELPLQPPGEPPCRRALTRSAKIIAVITLSFRWIPVPTVINSLNNSKDNYSSNNTHHHGATTCCTITTTHSKAPRRAREPERRTRAPQGARSALFISITTN